MAVGIQGEVIFADMIQWVQYAIHVIPIVMDHSNMYHHLVRVVALVQIVLSVPIYQRVNLPVVLYPPVMK